MLLDKQAIFYRQKYLTILKVFLFILLFVIMIILLLPLATEGSEDWTLYLRPAVYSFIKGESPYSKPFANPPWTLIPLIPLALLPARLGSTILVISSPFIFAFVAYKVGGKLLPVIFFAFSSPVIHNAFSANIDFLPALGLIMPPQIGLFFVFMKPQTAIGVAAYWFFEAWRKNGIKEVIRIFWPVSTAFLLSFVIYGFWPLDGAKVVNVMVQQFGDKNAFPWSVPFGLGLLLYAIRMKNQTLSISASPLLSPYVAMHSWTGFLIGIINYPFLSITFCIIFWIISIWT